MNSLKNSHIWDVQVLLYHYGFIYLDNKCVVCNPHWTSSHSFTPKFSRIGCQPHMSVVARVQFGVGFENIHFLHTDSSFKFYLLFHLLGRSSSLFCSLSRQGIKGYKMSNDKIWIVHLWSKQKFLTAEYMLFSFHNFSQSNNINKFYIYIEFTNRN